MKTFWKTTLSAAFIGLAASTFGATAAQAAPTSIDSQDGAGGKVDRDGTRGAIDRDGTVGDFIEAIEGELRDAIDGEMSGPDMIAIPGLTSQPARGF